MIDSIGKITLYVNNQNEARDFWTEKMGFIVRLEQQMGADQKWLEVGPEYGGGTSFVLYDKEKMKTQNPDVNVGHPSVILCTGDLENAHEGKRRQNRRHHENALWQHVSVLRYGWECVFAEGGSPGALNFRVRFRDLPLNRYRSRAMEVFRLPDG